MTDNGTTSCSDSDPGGGWTSTSDSATGSLSAATTWDLVTGYPTAWAEANFPSGYAPSGSGTMRVQATITVTADPGTDGIINTFFYMDSTDAFGASDQLGGVWRPGDALPGQIQYDETLSFSGNGSEPLWLRAYVQAEGGGSVTMTVDSFTVSTATCD